MYYYECDVIYWEKSSHRMTSKQTDVNGHDKRTKCRYIQ